MDKYLRSVELEGEGLVQFIHGRLVLGYDVSADGIGHTLLLPHFWTAVMLLIN